MGGGKDGVIPSRCATAVFTALTLCCYATIAFATEPRAVVQGDLDRALRGQIEAAIGRAEGRPASRFDARRRARQAAADATALLRSEGYYLAEVDAQVGAEASPRAIIKVTPGPRFVLGLSAWQWVGETPDPEAVAAAQKATALVPGAPGRAADVLAAEGRIVAALQKAGYADATAEPRRVVVDDAARTVTPAFRVAAGDRVRLDGAGVVTKGRTRVSLVRGLLPWKSGDYYDPAKLALPRSAGSQTPRALRSDHRRSGAKSGCRGWVAPGRRQPRRTSAEND